MYDWSFRWAVGRRTRNKKYISASAASILCINCCARLMEYYLIQLLVYIMITFGLSVNLKRSWLCPNGIKGTSSLKLSLAPNQQQLCVIEFRGWNSDSHYFWLCNIFKKGLPVACTHLPCSRNLTPCSFSAPTSLSPIPHFHCIYGDGPLPHMYTQQVQGFGHGKLKI